MKKPLISVSWWDWGRSGPQRRWQFPSSHRKRVSAQLTLGPITFGAGQTYRDSKWYVSLFVGQRRVGWRQK